jgi:hypothetical protein
MWAANDRDNLERYCAMDVDLTAKLSLLENINVNGQQRLSLPQHVHGLRSALAARRATGAQKRLREKEGDDEGFVLV